MYLEAPESVLIDPTTLPNIALYAQPSTPDHKEPEHKQVEQEEDKTPETVKVDQVKATETMD